MRGICKRFGPTVALEGVSLSVFPGEVHALVGENGAGKSTLMKILSGAHLPDSGAMELEGESFAPKGPLGGRRAGIGMIYQELSIAPHLTVAENILLGIEPGSLGVLKLSKVDQIARDVLEQIGHGDIDPAVKAGTLSVSEQQLVEVCRALALGCRVIVFDEPTSSLAQEDIRRLFEIIGRLKEQGIAIVYISHFLDEVNEIADRLTVLRDGAVVGTREVNDITTDEIVSMMVGRDVEELYPRSDRQRGEVVLELDGLSGRKKPKDVSLQLHRGEVLGICGLVGAGRTELLRTVFGLDPIANGTVRVGAHLGAADPRERWTQGVGFLSEDRKLEGLTLNMSIADNVTMTRLSAIVKPTEQDAQTGKWVERLGIRCHEPAQSVQELSGGNQQKVALARLLEHDVDVLLLDEPTRGIDVGAKAVIYEVIDELASGDEPKAVLMVSSYLPELLGVCDRIAVMCKDRLAGVWDAADANEETLMRAATGNG